MFIIAILVYMQIVYTTLDGATQNGAKYSSSYALHYPVEFLQMLFRTISTNITYYFESIVGRFLGWNQVVQPAIVSWAFVFMLIYSTYFHKTGELIVQKKVCWMCLAVFIMEAGLIFLALLGDTTWQAQYIEGVQGRYFIPVLPILMVMFSKKNDDSIADYKIMKYYMVIEAFQVYYMMKLFLAR